MHVHCWVRLDERNFHRLYDDNGDMCCVSGRQVVLWWRGPTRCVHVHCGLLFGRWYCDDVRG